MKKFLIPITGLLIFFVALISWQGQTQSKGIPYANPTPPDDINGTSACLQSVANEIYFMRNAWNNNLNDAADQEKATSEVVDEAFESMRTYRCWLDYMCEAVRLSSYARSASDVTQTENPSIEDVDEAIAYNLVEKSGCVDAENTEIPGTKIKFMEFCAAGVAAKETFTNATKNYTECRELIGYEFGEKPKDSQLSQEVINKITEESTAFVALEKVLRTKSAEKKNRAMQTKLESIVRKLHGMEAHTELLKQYINTFDQKLPCYAKKCD